MALRSDHGMGSSITGTHGNRYFVQLGHFFELLNALQVNAKRAREHFSSGVYYLINHRFVDLSLACQTPYFFSVNVRYQLLSP